MNLVEGVAETSFDITSATIVNDVYCQRFSLNPGDGATTPCGLGAMWIHTPSGTRSAWDVHEDTELVIGIRGTGSLLFDDGTRVTVSPGKASVVPPHVRHAYEAVAIEDFLVASVFWVEG